MGLVFTGCTPVTSSTKGQGGAYSFSGGLRRGRVGDECAVHTRLEVTTYRGAQVAHLSVCGGDARAAALTRSSKRVTQARLTTDRAWPDARYFESSQLPQTELTHLLRSKAVLMPGVAVTLTNRKNPQKAKTWQYKGGLRDYLQPGLCPPNT